LRLRPGQARVQFLACKVEIADLFEKGHSMVETLEILKKQEKLTIAYYTFRELVLEYFYNQPKKKKRKIVEAIIQNSEDKLEATVEIKAETAKVEPKNTEHQPKIITVEKQGFGDRDNDSAFDPDEKF